MTIQIENFDDNQLSLITTGTTAAHVYDESKGDYIRIVVYNKNGNNPITLSDGSKAIFNSNNGDFDVFSDIEGNVYTKPNKVLGENLVPSGTYRLKFDILRDVLFGEFNDEESEV